MAMHNTNSILKYVVPVVILVIVILLVLPSHHKKENVEQREEIPIKNLAAHDSAAESLDTLTVELSETKQKINEVSKSNEQLKSENNQLYQQLHQREHENTLKLKSEMRALKDEIKNLAQMKQEYKIYSGADAEVITTVTDLSKNKRDDNHLRLGMKELVPTNVQENKKPKKIPYYTIPANATSVKDRLMTALVGRIPVKGVVTDPYPFKIVVSDDTLAANGLRIPHLTQMIVSGYCEGDLNLVSVRGWVTSLTFVFEDGTISTTTSNDNDIGNFTKANSLGYLSDKYGNPFIQGKLITNAPQYLGGNIALGVGKGAADAYAQSQTTNTTSFFGNTNSTVTGSPTKFMLGNAASSGMNEAQQWWRDREQQSFDAIYVAPMDKNCQYAEIAINFAKEIHIDYDPKGRKLNYAYRNKVRMYRDLD